MIEYIVSFFVWANENREEFVVVIFVVLIGMLTIASMV